VSVGGDFLSLALVGLAFGVLIAFGGWLRSLMTDDVSIVDSLWPVIIFAPAVVFAVGWPAPGPRLWWVLALAGAWSLRLCVHLTRRNHGQPEDPRYQEIRRRNEPGFRFKSLCLVFLLQVALAWIVSMPLMTAIASPAPLGWLDAVGIAIAAGGIVIEAVADRQLTRFRADTANRGRVLDTGLWRYSRHPNYFGECCTWWGLFLVALSGGASWTIVSPLLMTVLLLKVSGVTLLEKDIGERRPAYRDYVARTSAFVPWWPKS
jgi:steroid 5-alpha reductase family enzyme